MLHIDKRDHFHKNHTLLAFREYCNVLENPRILRRRVLLKLRFLKGREFEKFSRGKNLITTICRLIVMTNVRWPTGGHFVFSSDTFRCRSPTVLQRDQVYTTLVRFQFH